MAVQTGSATQAQAQTTTSSPAAAPAGRTGFSPVQVDWTFGKSLTGPIGGNLPNDQLFTLTEKMAELIKKYPDPSYTLQVIPVDGNVNSLYYSAVVATVTEAKTPGRKAFFTFVLTETNMYPKPDQETWNGQQIQVDVTPDQVYDMVFAERVLNLLQA